MPLADVRHMEAGCRTCGDRVEIETLPTAVELRLLSALYASQRLPLPLHGVLLVGY